MDSTVIIAINWMNSIGRKQKKITMTIRNYTNPMSGTFTFVWPAQCECIERSIALKNQQQQQKFQATAGN